MASNHAPSSRNKTRSPVNQTVKPQPSAPVRLKTVVRRLPPNLPEAVFWQSVDQWVSEESVSWKVFCPGKLRKKLHKESVPSRAYILFKHEETLASFSRGYDGHVFRDKQGNESYAVVEYAPNQKVPPEKKKVDSRHATIQQDEDYLSFVASLQNDPAKTAEVDIDALLASTQPSEEPTITPLLAALRDQKASHERKLAASEAARAHSKKSIATSAAVASAPKAENETAVQPAAAAKRSRKGKGSHQPVAPTAIATPTPASTPAKSSKAGRSRAAAAQEAPPTVIVSNSNPPSVVSTSSNTELSGPAVDEPTQRRNRPILGLQSRHLKAALNGAGVTVLSASPNDASSSVSGNGSRSGGPSRGGGAAGNAGERHHEKEGKEGPPKAPGGGRKEKARSRHHGGGAGYHPGGVGRGMDITPRIISRQDPAGPHASSGSGPAKEQTSTSGSQEPPASRGRNRRGRGQS